jgi:hypothetical protein
MPLCLLGVAALGACANTTNVTCAANDDGGNDDADDGLATLWLVVIVVAGACFVGAAIALAAFFGLLDTVARRLWPRRRATASADGVWIGRPVAVPAIEGETEHLRWRLNEMTTRL